MTTQLVEYNVTDAQINEMSEKFLPLKLSGVDDKEGFKKIVEYRKDIRKLRLSVEEKRKSLKADSLEYGRRVDAEAKRITLLLTPIENHLTEQENIVKKEKERLKAEEQERINKAHQHRIERLIDSGAVFNGSAYCWGEVENLTDASIWLISESDFSQKILEINVWKKLEDGKKAEADRIQKEKEAEQEKIAEQQRKDKEEMERKQAEMDKQAAEIKAAQDKIEADRLALEKAEKDRLQKIEDDKQAKIKAEQDEKQRIETEKRHAEEIEAAKIKAAKDAKIKAEEDAKKAELKKLADEKKEKAKLARIERLKPDKEKILNFVKHLSDIVLTDRPELKSKEAFGIMNSFNDSLLLSISELEKEAKNL